MTIKQAEQIVLPKWPQCQIKGSSVTKQQALDIIGRTDAFICSLGDDCGNNHAFEADLNTLFQFPRISVDANKDEWKQYMADRHQYQDKYGLLRLDYLATHWVSCCYFSGPNGWCHPDGTISWDLNIGKWPTMKEVIKDLKTIAAAFPYLDMQVTLMSDERGEDRAYPLVTFNVAKGKVRVAKVATELDISAFYQAAEMQDFMRRLGDVSNENTYTFEQIKSFVSEGLWLKNQEAKK